MAQEYVISVRPDGTTQFIHDDALAELFGTDVLVQQGAATIERASNVEPDANGQWVADMAPVGGPCLPPCKTRREALEKEAVWLTENYLTTMHGRS